MSLRAVTQLRQNIEALGMTDAAVVAAAAILRKNA